ncbi:TadE/TadG family type IV pilus assembly protein [Sphingomonas sp.]|uniref:TadE/TadG family type IV pilus assembly protein n=1 Tax=Sphingomonas sp. TaxID=28214 RepID=UPI0035684D76
MGTKATNRIERTRIRSILAVKVRDFIVGVSGTAVIEMALVLPLLLMLVMGVVTYGHLFFRAHDVQEAANDAARATISGLNAAERASIAQESVQTSFRRTGTLDPTRSSIVIEDDGTTLVVRLTYDASNDPLLSLGVLPVQDRMIRRSAAIRLGAL